MLDGILKLSGAQKLNKKDQETIQGGGRSSRSDCDHCNSYEKCVRVYSGPGGSGSPYTVSYVCIPKVGHQ